MLATHWWWLDPVVSIILSVIILHDAFKIEHATIQLEPPEQGAPCALAPADRV